MEGKFFFCKENGNLGYLRGRISLSTEIVGKAFQRNLLKLAVKK